MLVPLVRNFDGKTAPWRRRVRVRALLRAKLLACSVRSAADLEFGL